MVFSSRSDSMAVDEIVHIPAGYLHVWQGDYLFNTEHPPLLNDLAGLFAKLAKPNVPAVPADFNGGDQWDYGDMFFYQSKNNVEKIVFFARLPFIFLTLGLVYLVFLWARALFGAKAGLLAATLTAFSPNILAHGRLATTDIGVVFFFVLTLWLLGKYLARASWAKAALLGISLGLTILAKFSGLAILPLILVFIIYFWLFRRPKLKTGIGQFLIIILIPVLMLWAVYAFSMRAVLTHPPTTYQSSKTMGYRTISSPLGKWLVMPFDKYIQGLEILSDHNIGGHWAYLNGEVSYRGWWNYFPLVLWYKMTLAELALLTLTAGVFVAKKKFRAPPLEECLIIVAPLFFLAVSMAGKIDIGVRHILPVLPFVYIFISRLVKIQNLYIKPLVWLLIVLQIAIGLLAYPNYLAYFNQIAGGTKNGIRHLADSNIDWNQNMKRLGEYAKKNNITKVYELCWSGYPFSYYGVESELLPTTPVSGVVVICAQQLVVTPEGFDISWVLKEPPDANIDYGMYIWRFDKNRSN